MLLNTKFAVLAALFAGSAQSIALSKRQGGYRFECDGNRTPDPSACDEIVSSSFADDTGVNKAPTVNGGGTPVLGFGLGESKNCQIQIVFTDKDFQPTNAQVKQGYSSIAQTCFVSGAGGSAVSEKYSIVAISNPDYVPSQKRQQPGDTSFGYGIHTRNAKPEQFRMNIGNGYPGGTVIEITEEMSVSSTVGFSSSVSSDFFGIVSASVGFDVSQTEEHSSTFGVTLTVSCDSNQTGQLFFQPYFETWFGAFSPSGSQLTVYRPETTGDNAAGEYGFTCTES